MESARRLSALGPDVLKIQFPIEVNYEADQAVWREACAELNDASAVPWALLSGGDPYETFKAQLQVACQAGCSGFMVGRALWREVISTTGSTRAAVLRDVVLPRFTELSQLATASGQGWQKKQADPPEIDENWFRQY